MSNYDHHFFDWVRLTAQRSAAVIVPILNDLMTVESVVDVGCAEGVWLKEWTRCGVSDVFGCDGDYVDQSGLMIEKSAYLPVDLNARIQFDRRFDAAMSLEVAEHLPPGRAASFIKDLCTLSDIVVFSAAQPGQGGDNHLNERDASWWANLFAEEGYAAFDCVRPEIAGRAQVAPWYRFNLVLYANAAGRKRLAAKALASRQSDLRRLDNSGDRAWRMRKFILRRLPASAVTALSRLRGRLIVRLHRLATAP